MTQDSTPDSNPDYFPLRDKDDYQSKRTEKTKIGEVLIFLHSFSRKFQIKVLSIMMFIYLVFVLHIFTLVYMFLSPEFTKTGEASESRAHLYRA